MASTQFETVFTNLIQDLSDYCKQYELPETALKWFQDVSILPYYSLKTPTTPSSKTSVAKKA